MAIDIDGSGFSLHLVGRRRATWLVYGLRGASWARAKRGAIGLYIYI